MPNPNTTIIWTPTFERHVTGYGSTSKHQKAIGLHAQTMLNITVCGEGTRQKSSSVQSMDARCQRVNIAMGNYSFPIKLLINTKDSN